MKLTLYKNFEKKINSTRIPTIPGKTIDVYLKQDTSIKNPTFILEDVDLDVNYCKFNGDYYYVTDITLNVYDQYELNCSMDDLASHRSEIGNTTAYVEYAESLNNPWIADLRLTMSQDIEVQSKRSSNLIFGQTISDVNPLGGRYVITLAGNNADAIVGMSEVYICTDEQIKHILYNCYGGLATSLKNLFNDVQNGIISCFWVPFDFQGTSNTLVKIGDFGIHVNDDEAGDLLYAQGGKDYIHKAPLNVTIEIPWIHNDWRDFSPYSILECYLPLVGVIELDASKLKGQTTLGADIYFDFISGDVTYHLYNSEVKFDKFIRINAAVPLATSGVNNDNSAKGIAGMLGGLGAAIGGAALAATGAGALVTAGAIAGGIYNMAEGAKTYFNQEAHGSGTNGNFSFADAVIGSPIDSDMRYITLTMKSHKFGVSTPSNINYIEGMPLFERKLISDLEGYVKCAGASVNMAGLESDKTTINNYLNAGFYFE